MYSKMPIEFFFQALDGQLQRNVTKYVNHSGFIGFIAWRYITPRRDFMF